MDFREFVINIAKFKWGLVSANTYYQNGKEYIYIMIAEKGSTGRFEKREFEVSYLNDILEEWFQTFI